MALPASGRMRQGADVNVELGNSATTQISLGQASVRSLYSVASGAIRLAADGYGKSAGIPFGCATYTTLGTFSFTVPAGITKISVVCVGNGGNGGYYDNDDNNYFGNGGGGGLSYTNCIPVTSGETLTVGTQITIGPYNYALVRRGCTTLIAAVFGRFNTDTSNSTLGTGAVKYNGGYRPYIASCGGGGAAGYAGNGGLQGQNDNTPATAGSGGGGGGGGSGRGGYPASAGGGGVGLIVQGSNGAAGSNAPSPGPGATGGGGGSGGAPGNNGGTPQGSGSTIGAYGGGAGMSYVGNGGGYPGIRIIYGGKGKSYPNNSAP
jgi:hypothetical protein